MENAARQTSIETLRIERTKDAHNRDRIRVMFRIATEDGQLFQWPILCEDTGDMSAAEREARRELHRLIAAVAQCAEQQARSEDGQSDHPHEPPKPEQEETPGR